MKYSPTTILHFLASRYHAIKALFRLGKGHNYIISSSQLKELEKTYELKDQLHNYKLVKPLENGDYQLEERYVSFFSFLTGDFSLDLPEQLAKYDQAIKQLIERLHNSEDQEDIGFVVQKLIEEINKFINHLDGNTAALEKEVDDLRTQQKEKSDPRERIYRASYLIDVFLHPLNRILEDHPDAISRSLADLRRYTYDQYLRYPDSYRHAPYLALHHHVVFAETKVQGHLRNLIRSLLPLLEQIRMNNRVLAGLKNFREFYIAREHDRYAPYLPHFIKGHRNTVYSYYREADAQARLDEIGQNKPLALAPTPASSMWQFRTSHYREQLLDSLPIANFYPWCYETLQKDLPKEKVTTDQVFQLANLMFDPAFSLTFAANRSQIALEDGILDIPQIQITNAHVLS